MLPNGLAGFASLRVAVSSSQRFYGGSWVTPARSPRPPTQSLAQRSHLHLHLPGRSHHHERQSKKHGSYSLRASPWKQIYGSTIAISTEQASPLLASRLISASASKNGMAECLHSLTNACHLRRLAPSWRI